MTIALKLDRGDGDKYTLYLEANPPYSVAYHVNVHQEGRQPRVLHGCILPEEFEAVALEMMKANEEAAVKAFGAALQTVQFIQQPEPRRYSYGRAEATNAPQTGTTTVPA